MHTLQEMAVQHRAASPKKMQANGAPSPRNQVGGFTWSSIHVNRVGGPFGHAVGADLAAVKELCCVAGIQTW